MAKLSQYREMIVTLLVHVVCKGNRTKVNKVDIVTFKIRKIKQSDFPVMATTSATSIYYPTMHTYNKSNAAVMLLL